MDRQSPEQLDGRAKVGRGIFDGIAWADDIQLGTKRYVAAVSR